MAEEVDISCGHESLGASKGLTVEGSCLMANSASHSPRRKTWAALQTQILIPMSPGLLQYGKIGMQL